MAGHVEKLVRVVARAFYNDEAVVVLEGLLREKFMKDDEMGSVVNLQTRQVRKVLAELQRDHMVSTETLNDKSLGGSSSMTYWYIDYQYFVDVVKYRLYKMNEFLKEREQLEMVRQTYRCSNESCGKEYTALEAQRLIVPGQHEFCCGHCGEPLLECNNNERLENIQKLQKKFRMQMNKQEGLHDGITELLRIIGEYCKNHTLPTNLPSENRAAGVGGESMRGLPNVNNGAGGRGSGGGGGGGGGGKKGSRENAESYMYPYGSQNQEIVVDIDRMDHTEDDILIGRKRKHEVEENNLAVKKAREQPSFLRGSAISGHMAAKYEQKRLAESMNEKIEKQIPIIHGLDHMNGNQSEEARQEAFKKAYMEEWARYNSTKGDKALEQVEIQLDRDGWDLDGADNAAEDLGEVEWEWCEEEMGMVVKDIEVPVQGVKKKISVLTDEDIELMTRDEYLNCYKVCVG